MAKVIFTMSSSVDGFIRAANPTPEEPLGQGGERLHEWAFGNPEGLEFLLSVVDHKSATHIRYRIVK